MQLYAAAKRSRLVHSSLECSGARAREATSADLLIVETSFAMSFCYCFSGRGCCHSVLKALYNDYVYPHARFYAQQLLLLALRVYACVVYACMEMERERERERERAKS